MRGWYWLIRRLSSKREIWQARIAPAYVHTATSTPCSYSYAKAKLTIVITTTVLTAMSLCPKHQQKPADAFLMVGDPFTFPQMMVSPTGFLVTTCRSCCTKGKLRIWVLHVRPLQLDKMSDAIWKKYVATSVVQPKKWLLYTNDLTCFRYLAVLDSCTYNRQKLC